MKIRKGKKYLFVINPFTNEAVIAVSTLWTSFFGYDALISMNTVGLKIYDCTFSEAVHNCKVTTRMGYYLSKRKY